MTVFFTSDTHFGHSNIIRYCTRPFGSVQEMDEELIRKWNAVVGPGDDVWHLGDFALERDEKRLKSLFRRLNGRKRLVVGNHDRQAVLELPWAAKPSQIAETSVDGQRIVMCHYAMHQWAGQHHGAVHLFGHAHGSLPASSASLDVGTDCWGFAPVGLEAIRARMAAA